MTPTGFKSHLAEFIASDAFAVSLFNTVAQLPPVQRVRAFQWVAETVFNLPVRSGGRKPQRKGAQR